LNLSAANGLIGKLACEANLAPLAALALAVLGCHPSHVQTSRQVDIMPDIMRLLCEKHGHRAQAASAERPPVLT
jgi:hypothetical protein